MVDVVLLTPATVICLSNMSNLCCMVSGGGGSSSGGDDGCRFPGSRWYCIFDVP